ncbi:MAG: hypothetical protein CME70_22280 [Halobacteriovorax sp.]|nr:hypothetical protein [Halobacteriovorax sp.]|tara:strand:- start:119657 stop:120244 length:588 start_codon:yes stop_codon:yes gene_type:complete
MKRLVLLFLFPLSLLANESSFTAIANKKCGKIADEKERNYCITGTFIDFCNKPKNQEFCKKEAARSDYSKRMEGAKLGLKKIYKNVKKNNGVLNLLEVFSKKDKESYYYIFGVPSHCKKTYKEGTPSNSSNLHGMYERTSFAEKGIAKMLNKFKCPRKGEFRVYAIGQIDDDLAFDVWYVDSKKRIKHFRSDFKR